MPDTPLEPFFVALRQRDMATASSYVSDDVLVTGMTLLPLRGREAWRRYVESFWVAFPDLRTELLQIIERPGSVTIRERIRGTHLGPLRIPPLAPVPPTGRSIDAGPSRITFHLRDGLVFRIDASMQRWQFVRQIGLWPFVLAALRAPFGG